MTRQQRLHAYEVLLRVAQVREFRASLALAEATTEELTCRTRHVEITTARDVVAAASRASASDSSSLDMARYEMLLVASDALVSAEMACQERASAAVTAKRYREKIGEHVEQGNHAMDQKRAAGRHEEAIELWLGEQA